MFLIYAVPLDELHGEGNSHPIKSIVHQLHEVNIVLLDADQLVSDQTVQGFKVILVFISAIQQASEERSHVLINI